MSVKIKILGIVLVFFALVAMTFTMYSRATTANYRLLRNEEMSWIVALESERADNIIAESEHNAVDLQMQAVAESLAAIKPTEGSFVLLGSPREDYIIYTTYKTGANYRGRPLSALSWYKAETFATGKDVAISNFALDGQDYVSFSRLLSNGWVFALQIPGRELYAQTGQANQRFIMIILLVSVILLVVAFFLLNFLINRPLQRLAEGMQELGSGNLDGIIDLNSRDEFGALALSLKRMTEDLKVYIEQEVDARAEKERFGVELDVAARIQSSLMPQVFPPFPERLEFDIHGFMLPAKEVDGDFYDFFLIDEHTLAVVIAHVSGQGVPASLFMVVAKTLIKNSAQQGQSPAQVFTAVNNLLSENNEANMSVRAFMGYLDTKTGKFTYVNAGHNPPLLRRGESLYRLPAHPSFVLAGWEDVVYKEDEITLGKYEELFFYSDGVTAAVNEEGSLFDDERILQVLEDNSELPLSRQLIAVKEHIEDFTGGKEQAGDITMLALKYCARKPESSHELIVDATMDNVETIEDFIGAYIEDSSPKTQNKVMLVADEVFSNIARYAYEGEAGMVTIKLTVGREVVLQFIDNGQVYNPLSALEASAASDSEEDGEGGLGVLMVKQLMDSVKYRREENKNILTLIIANE